MAGSAMAWAWGAAMHGSPLLLDAGVKSLGVMALACAAAWALRRAGAAVRHLVWTLALLSLLLLPVLAAALPAWRVLPSAAEPKRETTTPAVVRQHPALTTVASDPAQERLIPSPALEQQSSAEFAHVNASGARPWAWPAFPGAQWLVIAWVAGSLVLVCRLALGLPGLWRLRRRARVVSSGAMVDELAALAAKMGVRRKVGLLIGAGGAMPATWGTWWAWILLPEEAEGWSTERRRVVLLHELAHIKRCDCLVHLLARVVRAIYWCNPLVWYAAARLRVECEQACDDTVLAMGTPTSQYARHLMDVATGFGLGRRMMVMEGVQPMARRSTLEGRLTAILDKTRDRRGLTRAAVMFGVVTLGLIIAPVSMLHGQEAAKKATGKSEVAPVAGTPTDHWTAPLPGGAEVELLGVGDGVGRGAKWWKPNGLPLAQHPIIDDDDEDSVNLQKGEKQVAVVVRVPGLPAGTSQLVLRREEGGGSNAVQFGGTPQLVLRVEGGGSSCAFREGDLVSILSAVPAASKMLNVSIGVTTGAWKTIMNEMGTGALAGGVPGGSVVFVPATEKDGTLLVAAAYDVVDQDVRIIAVDTDGNEHEAENQWVSSANKVQVLNCIFSQLTLKRVNPFPELTLKHVKEFRFQTRPYTWVKFHDVAAVASDTPREQADRPE